jgi:hypothetical protein
MSYTCTVCIYYILLLTIITTRAQTCRASIKLVVSEHLQACDVVTMLTFSATVQMLFHRYKAEAQCTEIFDAIDKRTQCQPKTAFYDAVKQAVDLAPTSALTASTGSARSSSSSRRRSSRVAADSRYDYWVCALTDGADNSSVHSVKTVLPVLRTSSCNAVFITVGPVQNAKSINQLAECAKRNGRVGLHISATGDSKGISEAFGQVAAMLGNVHMESL